VRVQRVDFVVSDGYAPLTPNADGSISVLPARGLLIDARVIYEGGSVEVSREVQVTSSRSDTVAVQPVTGPQGNVVSWWGRTLAPGTTTLQAQWAGYQASRTINVRPGLILQAPSAWEGSLTENAVGRTTAYMQVGGDLGSRQLVYSESASDNQWSTPRTLPTPSAQLPILNGGMLAAEAPNGYRATLTANTVGAAWVHLIGPDGEVKGPVVVANAGSEAGLLAIAVTVDGNAHLWLREHAGVTRKLVRFADAQGSTVSTLPLAQSDVYTGPQVAVSRDGTIGLAWADASCYLHFAVDNLLTPGGNGPTVHAPARVTDCTPLEFANIFTQLDVGAGAGDVGVIITYGTAFNAAATDIAVSAGDGSVTMSLVGRDTPISTNRPRIGMSSSGEFVAIWPTSTGGVWGVHRAASTAMPEAPFVVEAPHFVVATPAVEGVHPREDGRFLLVWPGGLLGERTPLEMRNYSFATGLSDRLSFPYQNSIGTNTTTLLATPFGVSAVWSFSADLDEVDVMQRFLP
jgi:hypothetical protein